MKKLVLTCVLALSAFSVSANQETRCGWIDNDLPMELTLQDKDGRWVIADFNFESEGFFTKMPNVEKGSTCACLRVRTDPFNKRILEIQGGNIIDVNRCLKDPALK